MLGFETCGKFPFKAWFSGLQPFAFCCSSLFQYVFMSLQTFCLLHFKDKSEPCRYLHTCWVSEQQVIHLTWPKPGGTIHSSIDQLRNVTTVIIENILHCVPCYGVNKMTGLCLLRLSASVLLLRSQSSNVNKGSLKQLPHKEIEIVTWSTCPNS